MKSIGIRALKAQLSQVLKEVQGGETVLVTDRGRVVAEMRRPVPTPLSASEVDDALARMAAAGLLRLAETPRFSYIESTVRLSEGTSQELLDAVREDRF
jgi:antitoxin (DNA-binding transcriptional repressor) of toxin-antitoxin stability system